MMAPDTALAPAVYRTPVELPQVVLLVVSDTALSQQLIAALACGDRPAAIGARCQLPIAASLAQARARLRSVTPAAILLDESVCNRNLAATHATAHGDPLLAASQSPLETAVRELARATYSGVVVVASPERQAQLSRLGDLVSSGAVDCVLRVGDFVPLAAALLERRLRARQAQDCASQLTEAVEGGPNPGSLEQAPGPTADPGPPQDFGEILRHEVNNPLTGILGNAELLLARRDRLPVAAAQRLEVIADLAVRLRETIRRLSHAASLRAAARAGP